MAAAAALRRRANLLEKAQIQRFIASYHADDFWERDYEQRIKQRIARYRQMAEAFENNTATKEQTK